MSGFFWWGGAQTSPAGAAAISVVAGAGSFTITGTAASLEVGRLLATDAGSYSVTGTAASLERGFEVAADAGSYTTTGSAVTLSQPHRAVEAGAGSYTTTGQTASLEVGRLLSAGAGSYATTGSDAALTIGAAGAITLVADAGSFAVTGTDASLEVGRLLAAAAGSYAVTGSDAGLLIEAEEEEEEPGFDPNGIPNYGGSPGGRGYYWRKKRRGPTIGALRALAQEDRGPIPLAEKPAPTAAPDLKPPTQPIPQPVVAFKAPEIRLPDLPPQRLLPPFKPEADDPEAEWDNDLMMFVAEWEDG